MLIRTIPFLKKEHCDDYPSLRLICRKMLLVPEISETKVMIFKIRTTAFKCLHFTASQLETPERSLQGVANWAFQRQQLLFGIYLWCSVMQWEAW